LYHSERKRTRERKSEREMGREIERASESGWAVKRESQLIQGLMDKKVLIRQK
jgi:hypothetical protein